jgi:hypothetical protein
VNDKDHSINPDKHSELGLARSLDGGKTWRLEDPGELANGFEDPVCCPEEIHFDHPDFAMKCGGSGWNVCGVS